LTVFSEPVSIRVVERRYNTQQREIMFCEIVQGLFKATERMAVIVVVELGENSCVAKKLADL
jgi:hypothetical protein